MSEIKCPNCKVGVCDELHLIQTKAGERLQSSYSCGCNKSFIPMTDQNLSLHDEWNYR